MKETLKHQNAFEFYYTLGPQRSLGKVAREFNVSSATVTNWAKALNWNQRVVERDNKNMASIRQKNDEEVVKQMQEYRKIIKSSVDEYLTKLNGGNVKIETVTDFARLVRLDMELCGFVKETYEVKEEAESDNIVKVDIDGFEDGGDKVCILD